MKENYSKEQYFFDELTISKLSKFLNNFENPCLLCAPMLGREVNKNHQKCIILDIDARFSDVIGFRYYDINNPHWIARNFDIILCDPPFFQFRFSSLFKAIAMLSNYDFDQKLMISYLTRRKDRFLRIFDSFRLVSTGYYPTYVSVVNRGKNQIEFFANLSPREIALLNEI
ncbi:MAG: hypothetical protein GF383_07550 [Candidatus Lokiarchaeota archaeon]|nr:hypothetical protein [Candidatus Lokiarchaeota archaeon]MBD3340105.1 hypothetical protein [Candidatus Lokiarchaeota archaeon]